MEDKTRKAIEEALLELKGSVGRLYAVMNDKNFDRHERGSISSDIAALERMIEAYEHYLKVGFIDF